MSITAGCDVGSLTAKAVIMEKGRILASAVIRSRARPEEASREVMDLALKEAALSINDLTGITRTGYGRGRMPFEGKEISEITCHGRGARWLLPSVKTLIDIGGQDCKAIKLKSDGSIDRFITNDKCASGTGRFLDVMAKVLGVPVEDLATCSERADHPVTFSSSCAVWAQADVIRLLNEGHGVDDIGAGINNAMAARVAVLLNSLGLDGDLCITGGVAKNLGVAKALETQLGCRVRKIRKADPQLAGAIGAALLAEENLK